MKSITIQGSKRGDLGKKATKAVRREGQVPCVIYGGKENVHFSAPKLAFRDIIYTSDFHTAEVVLDNGTVNCIVKSVDFHPVTDEILHIDFIELVPKKKFKVSLPVRTQGVAPGVKTGGILLQKLRKVQIKTTPEALVPELFIDISSLELGSSMRVSDIDLIEGMEIMNAGGIPVASVEVPRALKSAEDEAEEGEEGEEGAEGTAEGDAAATPAAEKE